jgi:hypothetical protein
MLKISYIYHALKSADFPFFPCNILEAHYSLKTDHGRKTGPTSIDSDGRVDDVDSLHFTRVRAQEFMKLEFSLVRKYVFQKRIFKTSFHTVKKVILKGGFNYKMQRNVVFIFITALKSMKIMQK